MINKFNIGDVKQYSKVVSEDETATFESGEVHPLYATFALARDAEWACRLFVLEMKEEDEEGIGTFVEVKHLSPAKIGAEVEFTATVIELKGNEIVCEFEAKVAKVLISKGRAGQKILKKDQVQSMIEKL